MVGAMSKTENYNEAELVREMVLAEASGKEIALATVGRAIGVSRWTVRGIFHGKRKDIGGRLSVRIRQAYLNFCRRQLAKAEASLCIAEGLLRHDTPGNFHDEIYRCQSEISDLARRISDAQSRLPGD